MRQKVTDLVRKCKMMRMRNSGVNMLAVEYANTLVDIIIRDAVTGSCCSAVWLTAPAACRLIRGSNKYCSTAAVCSTAGRAW